LFFLERKNQRTFVSRALGTARLWPTRADALLTRDERAELVGLLAFSPHAGELVPGLGGIRKLRLAADGRGKSGAYRVIYYVADEKMPILALLPYGKTDQAKPTPDQRKAMLAVVELIKAASRTQA
jgi:hypothetical protein